MYQKTNKIIPIIADILTKKFTFQYLYIVLLDTPEKCFNGTTLIIQSELYSKVIISLLKYLSQTPLTVHFSKAYDSKSKE